MGFDFPHDRLQPFLEITAIAGPGKKSTHIERENRRLFQNRGDFPMNNFARQSFGDCGFSDTRFADKEWVVLLPAAQNLDRSHNFVVPADQRVDTPLARLLVEVNAI